MICTNLLVVWETRLLSMGKILFQTHNVQGPPSQRVESYDQLLQGDMSLWSVSQFFNVTVSFEQVQIQIPNNDEEKVERFAWTVSHAEEKEGQSRIWFLLFQSEAFDEGDLLKYLEARTKRCARTAIILRQRYRKPMPRRCRGRFSKALLKYQQRTPIENDLHIFTYLHILFHTRIST